MSALCLYFRFHQPFQLKQIDVKNFGPKVFEDVRSDKLMVNKLADESILPAIKMLLLLIKKMEGKFKFALSISGTTLELLEYYRVDVIHSISELVGTGCVEIVGETYYNSLSSLYSITEFERQALMHRDLIKSLFFLEPSIFINTDLIHNNSIATQVQSFGFKGMVCDAHEQILQGRSVHKVYESPVPEKLPLMFRDKNLSQPSNDFLSGSIPAKTWVNKVSQQKKESETNNIFIDLTRFGQFVQTNDGQENFSRAIEMLLVKNDGHTFLTPSEVLSDAVDKDTYDAPQNICCGADTPTRPHYLENKKNADQIQKLYALEKMVIGSNKKRIKDTWGRLQDLEYLLQICGVDETVETSDLKNPYQKPKEVIENMETLVTEFARSISPLKEFHNSWSPKMATNNNEVEITR